MAGYFSLRNGPITHFFIIPLSFNCLKSPQLELSLCVRVCVPEFDIYGHRQ